MPEDKNLFNTIHGEPVFGVDVDGLTHCAHWHDENDIIAIRFHCCERWYACYECHTECADHPATVWPAALWNTHAILCGACGRQLSISEYMNGGFRCPTCDAGFNPGCRSHYHLYFATTSY